MITAPPSKRPGNSGLYPLKKDVAPGRVGPVRRSFLRLPDPPVRSLLTMTCERFPAMRTRHHD